MYQSTNWIDGNHPAKQLKQARVVPGCEAAEVGQQAGQHDAVAECEHHHCAVHDV